jgi:F0F1-type ATP synthase membrane subunit b/b'
MEPSIDTLNLGLLIWQLLALIAVVLVFFLLLKIYKKISKYLDVKIKYLEKRIEAEDE